MSRRALVRCAAVLALLLTVAGTGLFRATEHVPDFYREALVAVPPPEVRREQSQELERQAQQLVEEADRSDAWSARFAQSQINSWLAEDFAARHSDRLPAGVRDPRVAIGEGWIACGVRIERRGWNGVVSLVLRPTMLGPNRLAVEVESVRAGLLPVPIESLLDEARTLLERQGLTALRDRRDGRDVLVLDLDPGKTADAVLESVAVESGVVTIAGRARKPESADGIQQSVTTDVARATGAR